MLEKPARLLLWLAYLGFISLGLPDAVLGIAWPSLRASFGLPQVAIGWILGAAATGYFLSGLFAGRLIGAIGLGSLLVTSTAVVVAGVLGYALAPSAVVFALAAMIVGWGSGAIDSGLNAHAAVHFRPGHMAWLHAAYSVGAAAGSMTMAAVVVTELGWRTGYAIVAAALALLTSAFFVTRRRWSPRGEATSNGTPETARAIGSFEALARRPVWASALLFFVYSGVEFGAGHWAYTILTAERGLSQESAGIAVSAYWTCLLLGRISAGFVVDRVGALALVRGATCVAVVGAGVFATPWLPAELSALGLALTGLALAPIYPGLMSETPRRAGDAAGHAVGFQVSAATAGMVVLPALGGLLADHAGLSFTGALIFACAVGVFAGHELVAADTRDVRVPT
jgi:fucose permease